MTKRNLRFIPLLMVIILAFTSACSKDDENGNQSAATFTDPRDGEIYKTVQIDKKVWMAENLRYLPEVFEPDSASTTDPLYYVLAYDGNNVSEAKASTFYETYGALYNWASAKIACPPGWHLPTDDEWMQLAEFVGGAATAGDKLKESGTAHWGVINDEITDQYGFTALPGGCCLSNGLFDGLENFGTWWTQSEIDSVQASYILMTHNGSGLYKGQSLKEHGFSVRCVKD